MIDKTHPPEFAPYMWYWERSTDPWHASAFPEELRDYAPNQTPEPQYGWMAIDGIENPMGFVPDSDEVTGATKFELRTGAYGRMCAYPSTAKNLRY